MTVVLVLGSAFLHALWNAQLRREAHRDRALVAAVAVAAALSGIIAMLTGAVPFATQASLIWACIAGVLELAYFVSLARALDRGPLGSVYTVTRGGAMVIAWPISVALLGESMTAASIAGTVLVLAGVACSGGGLALPRAALGWSIFCAFAIAGYHLAYKQALATGGSAPAVFAVSLGIATLVNVLRLGKDIRRIPFAPRIILMGAVCAASFLLLLDALASGGTGVVLTTRNTSVLFALILAAVIGDRPTRRQIVGAVLVAAGAVVMS